MLKKHQDRIKRHIKLRKVVTGTAERPRLAVYRGLKHLHAQLIDDATGRTLTGLSDKAVNASGNGIERAKALGSEIAKRAQAMNVSSVVFDRGGFAYHGQVKAVAEAVREAGINI